jgi:hypothetical protein
MSRLLLSAAALAALISAAPLSGVVAQSRNDNVTPCGGEDDCFVGGENQGPYVGSGAHVETEGFIVSGGAGRVGFGGRSITGGEICVGGGGAFHDATHCDDF